MSPTVSTKGWSTLLSPSDVGLGTPRGLRTITALIAPRLRVSACKPAFSHAVSGQHGASKEGLQIHKEKTPQNTTGTSQVVQRLRLRGSTDQVRSLVRELRSRWPRGVAKN